MSFPVLGDTSPLGVLVAMAIATNPLLGLFVAATDGPTEGIIG